MRAKRMTIVMLGSLGLLLACSCAGFAVVLVPIFLNR